MVMYLLGDIVKPQPGTLEEQEKAYEAYLKKLKSQGETNKVPKIPFV